MTKKKIKFIADSKTIENLVPMPKPAKACIPDWYKETTMFYSGKTLEIGNNFKALKTIKACMPVLDSITAGYIQETWQDFFIEHNDEGGIRFASPNGDIEMVAIRDHISLGKMPIPEGHAGFFLHWNRVWAPVLPKGYSAIIQHPAYGFDLPFTVVPAIIDADEYNGTTGKVGFFIKKDFQGLIPMGTPMYQIIPFKREAWESEKVIVGDAERLELDKQNFAIRQNFIGSYKKKFWQRKDFS